MKRLAYAAIQPAIPIVINTTSCVLLAWNKKLKIFSNGRVLLSGHRHLPLKFYTCVNTEYDVCCYIANVT